MATEEKKNAVQETADAKTPETTSETPSATPAPKAEDDFSAAAKEMNEAFKTRSTFAKHYLLDENGFYKDADVYAKYANYGTGYVNLDRIQSFCPGLYVIGAISSLGKTTFVHQMADQIAESGRNVMYFSLEQSHFELYSKSLARRFALTSLKKNGGIAPSSSALRRKDYEHYPDQMDAVVRDYAQRVDNSLCIYDGMFEMTVEQIVKMVETVAKKNLAPVVFVDYLQIIAPTPGKNGHIPDTKTTVDHAIHALKVLQAKYNLTIVVVSSINRANYMMPIGFESFKESGGIEFTADVVWGMQLSIIGTDAYQKYAGRITEQRKITQKAKAQDPRFIDLVYLKNRFGPLPDPMHFQYFPGNELFFPCERLAESQITAGIIDGASAQASAKKPEKRGGNNDGADENPNWREDLFMELIGIDPKTGEPMKDEENSDEDE